MCDLFTSFQSSLVSKAAFDQFLSSLDTKSLLCRKGVKCQKLCKPAFNCIIESVSESQDYDFAFYSIRKMLDFGFEPLECDASGLDSIMFALSKGNFFLAQFLLWQVSSVFEKSQMHKELINYLLEVLPKVQFNPKWRKRVEYFLLEFNVTELELAELFLQCRFAENGSGKKRKISKDLVVPSLASSDVSSKIEPMVEKANSEDEDDMPPKKKTKRGPYKKKVAPIVEPLSEELANLLTIEPRQSTTITNLLKFVGLVREQGFGEPIKLQLRQHFEQRGKKPSSDYANLVYGLLEADGVLEDRPNPAGWSLQAHQRGNPAGTYWSALFRNQGIWQKNKVLTQHHCKRQNKK